MHLAPFPQLPDSTRNLQTANFAAYFSEISILESGSTPPGQTQRLSAGLGNLGQP